MSRRSGFRVVPCPGRNIGPWTDNGVLGLSGKPLWTGRWSSLDGQKMLSNRWASLFYCELISVSHMFIWHIFCSTDTQGPCSESEILSIDEETLRVLCLGLDLRNLFTVPWKSCPVGSRRDYLGQCQSGLQWGTGSSFGSSCPIGTIRNAFGRCVSWFSGWNSVVFWLLHRRNGLPHFDF